MKIVSISDVHMATRNLARMTEVWRDTDLAIVAGDLTDLALSGFVVGYFYFERLHTQK